MARQPWKDISQVLAIVRVGTGGTVLLKKVVRDHLGLAGNEVRVTVEDEVLLSANGRGGSSLPLKRNRLVLPEQVAVRLGIGKDDRLGFVQRDGATVALKRVSFEERTADWPGLLDVETPPEIVRVARANLSPDRLSSELQDRVTDRSLRFSVASFLHGRRTIESWGSRRLLGLRDPTDGVLQQALVRHRVEQQSPDGSWAGAVPATARNLRELATLGLGRGDGPVDRAAAWLLGRAESTHNPGMFFLTDDLVGEQARIVEERIRAKQEGTRGPKPRFRALLSPEKKLLLTGDDIIRTPCGPRLMWPNALTLEALIWAGYEEAPRVRVALDLLMSHDWCECGYQHGTSGWGDSEPLTDEQLDEFENLCRAEFRYGDVACIEALEVADMAHAMGFIPRVARSRANGADEYWLRRNVHIQGCEAITTRAVARSCDQRVRRFAAAHLWRFAGRQVGPDGSFVVERHGWGMSPAGLLQIFARYDHPASRVAILRSIPWIVESQNEDGSWGGADRRDSETQATVEALCAVRNVLPSGFLE